MLLLDSASEAGGLTVYADHVASHLFHYLPVRPRIVAQPGNPGIQLLRYRGGVEGAHLGLDVDLAVTDTQLDRARSELSARHGADVTLVPVLFRDGTVRISVLSAASDGTGATNSAWIVETILASATPSLLGRARAVFSVQLGREASTLVDEALAGRALPVIVTYDLAFDGLQPARGLRVHVDYRMAYDYLRARLRADTLFFKADIDRETESLSREGHLSIEDVDYSGHDAATLAARREEARRTVGEIVESLFFRPAPSPAAVASTLPPASPLASAWAARANAQAAFVFRGLAQQESMTFDYDYRETRVASKRVGPQGALSLPDGVDPASVVRDVTLDSQPTVADIHVFALGDADWTGVSAITIDVRNGAGDAGSCVVTPAAAEHHLALPLAPPFEMRTRVLADVDPEALGAAPGEASPFAPMDGWTVPVDPALLAGRRVIALGLGHAGAGLRVQGRLATGVDHREFVLDAGRPEVRVPVWQSAPVRIEWATELDGSTGPSAARTLSAGETSVVFNEPADRFRTVTVMLQDPLARLASVSVEIESQPGGSRRAVRVDAATPRATLSIEKPGADGAARFRATVVALDGATAEDSWRDLAGSLLIVGDRGLRVERIHGVLAGVPESLGALVRLTSLSPPPGVSPASEVVLDPGVSEFDLALAFADDAPRRYRVEGQLFLADGERTIGPLEEDAEVLILDVSAA